jgi:integrase/recombinase XerD
MAEIGCERYPRAAELDVTRAWLVLQHNLGLAPNTIDAYGRALEEFLAFSATKETQPRRITLPRTSGT